MEITKVYFRNTAEPLETNEQKKPNQEVGLRSIHKLNRKLTNTQRHFSIDTWMKRQIEKCADVHGWFRASASSISFTGFALHSHEARFIRGASKTVWHSTWRRAHSTSSCLNYVRALGFCIVPKKRRGSINSSTSNTFPSRSKHLSSFISLTELTFLRVFSCVYFLTGSSLSLFPLI